MRTYFKLFTLLLFAASLLVIGSCKRESKNFAVNYQYNYYPLDSGHYVIYNVDSIQYNFNGIQTYDTITYQEMQVITDTFYDNQNRLNHYVDNYRRTDSTQPWVFDRRWYALLTTTNLQLNEDDLRFVKLVFPPALNETWNGNIYLPTSNPLLPGDQYAIFQNWSYFYDNVDTTFNLNNLIINNTIVVSEVNQITLVANLVRTEAYAPNIGLIYQQWDNLVAGGNGIVTDWNYGNISGYRIRWWVWQHYP